MKWQKGLLIASGIFIALGALGALLPEVEQTEDSASVATTTQGELLGDTTTTTPETTTTTSTLATTTTEGAETTTTVPQTTTTPPFLPGIGDPVRDGKFEFVVTEIEEPGKIYDPDNLLEDVAVGKWFIVSMTVENIGDQEQTFSARDQKVLWDNKEFSAEGFTWNGSSFEALNPGIVLKATVMFDMPASFPEGGVGTVLELHDSVFSGGANVYL